MGNSKCGSRWLFAFPCLLLSLLLLHACASDPEKASLASHCAAISSDALIQYDNFSSQFLDEATRHPDTNSGGNIIWGTRYYMESLLDAYDATGNPKYIQAFLDTGTFVMNDVQSLTLVDVVDPSAPGSALNSPTITAVGWPTQLGSFSESVAIPTPTGQTSLYAQNLDPTDPAGPIYFEVTSQSDGTLALAWVGASQTLETHTVQTVADLSSLAAAPLVEGQSRGRIKSTGLGLPAAGTYQVNSPIQTIWHEQTGGILLPIVRFLYLVSKNPGLADPNLVANWKSQAIAIAASYEDEFVSDNNGGLRFVNPIWLPNAQAATDAAADYIAVEATVRMYLYALTGDPNQLAISKGLITHQKTYHWNLNPQGWLLLQSWPCLIPWSARAAAPVGAIWDTFDFDTTAPATVEEGATFVDMIHHANLLGLSATLGISADITSANQNTLKQFLFVGPSAAIDRPAGILRGSYPTMNSTATDPLSTSQYTWSGAWYVAPETADQTFVDSNWSWMLQFNQSPQGGPIGYFLRSWAMSEAAESSVCKSR